MVRLKDRLMIVKFKDEGTQKAEGTTLGLKRHMRAKGYSGVKGKIMRLQKHSETKGTI